MKLPTMRQKANRVTRFVIVQFIALVGWIIVQSFFSLSPAGRTIPFAIVVLIEAIWWIALLGTMLWLFLLEYNRFAQSAIQLEEANTKLREATNQLLEQMRGQGTQNGSELTSEPAQSTQDAHDLTPELVQETHNGSELTPEPVQPTQEASELTSEKEPPR